MIDVTPNSQNISKVWILSIRQVLEGEFISINFVQLKTVSPPILPC
jgi:hypothetical protein